MTTRNLILVIIFAIIHCFHLARTQSDICTLGGHIYNAGDTWNPKLIPYDVDTCINCTCLKGGEVKCAGVECAKPECEDPVIIPGYCCPTCEGRKEKVKDDLGTRPGCEFHGVAYDDGDVFPSSKTALKPKHENQCVLCTCYRGKVICHLKTCLQSLACRKTITVDDDCCPHCEETISRPNPTLEDGDCLFATERHRNGSTWKPIIGPYGTMECIECTCIEGQVDCGRLKCPDESALKCKNPEPSPGGCCKQCPRKRNGSRRRRKMRRRCKQLTDNNERLECRKQRMDSRRNKGNKQTYDGNRATPVFHDSQPLDTIITKLCMPGKNRHLVYHLHGDNFDSLAFDGPSESFIEQLYWTIDKGQLQATQRKVIRDPSAFRKNLTISNIIGATKKKAIRRFKKRLNRRQQKCKQRCKRKVLLRSMKKLKLEAVNLFKSCNLNH